MEHLNEPETKLPPAPDASPQVKTLVGEPPSPSRPGGPEIPERIGAYKILRKLGEGGMGYVLLAMRDDGQFQQRVAIKLIKRGMDTDEVLRRFEFERQILGSLVHENIARLYDGGATEDGRPYFVLEYVEGEPIDKYCDSQQLSIAERLALFRKVCAAMQYAHQNLIVHRDIKPGNILVNPQGEPKLLDFGIAKLLRPDSGGAPVATLSDMRLMTPEYASPEQVQGKPITTATDVYSLGVLLYELLTGHPPYHLRTRMRDEIERVICTVEPERPSTAISRTAEIPTEDGHSQVLTPEDVARFRDATPIKAKKKLSGDLDNIVLMALRKTPRRRYSSVEQFSEDIRRHAAGLPVIARKETWSYVLSKFVQRNRIPVAAAATVFLALSAGIVSTSVMARIAEERRVEAKKQEQAAVLRTAQLREVCRKFLTDFYQQVERLEGGSVARASLAKASVAVLRSLALEPGVTGDETLRGDLALGLERAGDAMKDAPDSARASREAYEQAYALRSGLGDPIAAARVRTKLAGARLTENNPTEARVDLEAVIAAASKEHASAEWRDVHASALEALSRVHRHAMRIVAADEAINEAVAIRESMPDAREARARAYVARAALSNEREHFDVALLSAERAVAIYATLPESDTAERLEAQRLAARLSMNLRNYSLARERFETARQIAERRFVADPLSVRAFDDLARVYEAFGDLEYEVGNFELSRDLYAEYLRRADEALARDPLSVPRARSAALAREKLADAHVGLERHTPEVLDLLDEAIRRYNQFLIAGGTDAGRYREDIARATLTSAYVLDILNTDESGAFDRYRTAYEQLLTLRGIGELTESEKLRLTTALRNGGYLALKLEKPEQAERFLTGAIDAAEGQDKKRFKLYWALSETHKILSKRAFAEAQAAGPDKPLEARQREDAGRLHRTKAREAIQTSLALLKEPFSDAPPPEVAAVQALHDELTDPTGG